MIAKSLRDHVYEANLSLVRHQLVSFTWGNASGVDRQRGWMAIKPSGIDYSHLQPEDIVLVDLETGRVIDGTLRPSSDTPTHRFLYLAFDSIGGIVHTHSRHATVWAQSALDIPCLGTTHADYFHGPIPCTQPMDGDEIADGYEHNTGVKILQEFRDRGLDPLHMQAILVGGHGPFTWGPDASGAVECAAVLEEVARMSWDTLLLNPRTQPIPSALLEKHFTRKHGPSAYYGQAGVTRPQIALESASERAA